MSSATEEDGKGMAYLGRVRVGLVGCGGFANFSFVPALNKWGGHLICSALYSRSKASAEKIRERLCARPKVFLSFEELAHSGIKAVLIITPPESHPHYVLESLKNGLDVFCEKPLTNHLREAMEIKSVLADSKNILMVGFNRRYMKMFLQVKAWLAEGVIGKVEKVSACYHQDIQSYLLKSDWLSDVRRSGGGVLHHAGVHFVNMMMAWFGKIERVHTEFRNVKLPPAFGEDAAFCRFAFAAGMQGSLDASFVNAGREQFVIEGKEGTLTGDLGSGLVTMQLVSGLKKDLKCRETSADSVSRELEHFYRCIKKRECPLTDIDDAIETMKVIDAARVSAIRKTEVCVDEASVQAESGWG